MESFGREFLQSPAWEILCLGFGLIVGSFANVVIYRWPRQESVVRPPSRCPACGQPIRAFDNIPILSWLALGGRCRHCRAGISARYPAVEAVNGLAWLALGATEGPTPRAVASMLFVTALIVLSLIDLDHQLLPNVITLPGIAVGIASSILPGSPVRPWASVAAAAGGYLAFYAVAEVYRRTRGMEGLGEGDWKMAAMIGAFLGWERMLLTIFMAALAGTLVGVGLIVLGGRTARHALPLGTFLGLAATAVLFVGDPLLDWYRGLMRG